MRLAAAVLGLVAAVANAQSGISRVGQQPVQPAPAPTLAQNAPPASAAQQQPASMMPAPISRAGGAGGQPPIPGGPLPAPVDLKREAIDRIAPLTPEEILDLRGELKRRADASQQPLTPVAKPTRRLVTLDLTPGAIPEVVRTAFAQGSVITFVDAAGRPWPVQVADNFNPSGFDVAAFGTNGVSIGVKSPNARGGNMAVLLEGLTTPVTVSMVTGQREVDYSVEMQLPRYLPGQPAPVGAVEQIRSLGAPDLMDFVLNTPPKSASPLVSDSANVKAWQISPERMIVRTEALVASPAWQRRQSSASGVTVYDLPLTPRIIVAAQGQMMNVRLSGFTATKEQR